MQEFVLKIGNFTSCITVYFFTYALCGNNKNLFVFNSDKHNASVRHANNLYQPSSNFTVYQKGVYCMGIKVYNNLPPYIKEESHNPRKFKTYLLHFLHTHYFYSIEECFQYKTSASYRLITNKH
jgi:hypothetical protein